MTIRPMLIALVLAAAAGPSVAMAQHPQSHQGWAEARYQRALANYRAVMRGLKPLGALSQEELRDILALDDELRRASDRRSPSERCLAEERERVGGSPSELEARVIAMKCREPGESLK